ncbi:phosphotransferase [Paenibacillus methanolicus]|uniref:Homoserine kinase type II n=1 Tax=Paenibacillus methanolicus TaxID=582686 RepID=A0A5S5C6C1_9BACL|nr:phosphotransferase [Paenibacillus methanolicus]TYP74709.1 homoserine kinase type II [Paenibacillus methanolicus]
MNIDRTNQEQEVLDDLLRACLRGWGWRVREAVPIKRGWMNLKWRIVTDEGDFLLKQYNRERYKLYDPEALSFAFEQQTRLHDAGLPCPRPLAHQDRVMLDSERGERFMVMPFCPGRLVPPGGASADQMYGLGRAAGLMHRLLNDGTNRKMAAGPQFRPPSREERLAHWDAVRGQAVAAGREELLDDIDTQRRATETIALTAFESLQTGWAHRDLWADNLLFDDSRVSAILDFDRLKYDYPALDIARAVLSLALGESLDATLAEAFVMGYREERALAAGELSRALQMLWYLESPWWITAEGSECGLPPERFAYEMNWLANNLGELRELVGGL